MICSRRKDMVMDRHILRSLTPQPPLLQRGGVVSKIPLKPPPAPPKEGSVGNNLLRDNLKAFPNQ